jgi:hypothetical protein
MRCKLLQGFLLAALFLQGGAQAAVPVIPDAATAPGCAGHGTDGDCCPDNAAEAASCQAQCGSVVALTGAPVAFEIYRPRAPDAVQPQPRAGPAYLPLNPPPIA